ncbi:MAG: hypothetical protein M3Y41_05265, partial [Pseudomonadota bacterium]|nr:hypothetical protein [Pseudomonadota bacterium]
ATAAAQLDALLGQAAQMRQTVHAALAELDNCSNAADAAQNLSQVAAQRRQLVDAVGSVDTAGLPGGPGLVSRMRDMWTYSAESDDDYAQWAQDSQATCDSGASAPLSGDPAQSSGDALSSKATASKQAFVAQWNPLAQQYGLATRSATGI